MAAYTHLNEGNFEKLLKALQDKNLTLKPSAFKENSFKDYDLKTNLELMLSACDLNYIGMISSNFKTNYYVTKVYCEDDQDYSGDYYWDCIEDAIASALIQYDYNTNNLVSVRVENGKIFFSDVNDENIAEISVINNETYRYYDEKLTKQVNSAFKGLLISDSPESLSNKLRKFSGLRKINFPKTLYIPSDLPVLRSINNFVFVFKNVLDRFVEEDVKLSMAQELFVAYFQTCSWHQLKKNEKEASPIPFAYYSKNNKTGEEVELYFSDHASGLYHLNKMLSKDESEAFHNGDFLFSNTMRGMSDSWMHELSECSIYKDTCLRPEPLDYKKTRAYKLSSQLRDIIDKIITQIRGGELSGFSATIDNYEPDGSVASGLIARNRFYLLETDDGTYKIAKEDGNFDVTSCDYETARIKETKKYVVIYSNTTKERITIEKEWPDAYRKISLSLGITSEGSDFEMLDAEKCWNVYNNI